MNMLECSWGATEALSAESITFVAQLHGLLTQANLLLGGTTDPTTTTTTTSTAPTTPRSRARAAVRPWLESTAKTVALAQTPVKATAPTTPLTTATTPTTTATTTNTTLQQQHVSAAAAAGQSPGCSPTSPNRDAINRAGSLSSVVTLEHTPLLAESNNNAPREGRGVGRPSHLHHLFSRGGTLVDLVRVMGQLLARNVANEVGGARITPVVCGILKLCQVHCVAVVEASLWLLFQEAYHNNNNNVPHTSSPAFDDDAGRWKRMETIADDVRLALAALRECGIVAADGLSPTDATSVRMAMEWAVFTLRKLRAAMARFELQIIHEERRRMHRASSNACGGDEWQTSHDPRVLAHLRTRVDELRRQVWGPSVCRALSHHVQQLMIAAVGQVVRVIDLGGVSAAGSSSPTPAGASASSSSSSLADLARDASTALFRLCDPVRAVSGGTAESSISSGPLFSSPPSARQVPPSSSSSPHHPHEVAKAHDDDDDDAQPQHSEADHSGSSAGGVGGGAAMVQQSSSGAMFPRVEIHTAMAVLPTLGISFMASYFAAIAQNAGEGSSGKLVATRILSDMLHDSCTNSNNNNNNNTLATSTTPIVWSVSGVLCFAVRESQWSHPLFGGLLSCVTSSLPVVLSAGLSALRAVVLECGTDLPAEVGLMYRSCLFPMLESDNSPAYVKMEVMVHLLTTFLRRGGGDGHHHHHREKDGEDGVGERTSSFMLPQLLRFYLAYDLNLAAPHLNVVQHLISTLSRLVRQAARSDFSTDASPQHHHQQQQLFHAATADDAEEEDASQALATYVRQQSLASIALYILVQAEELLTLLAPDEEEIVAGSASCTISALPHRDAKVDAQRQADFFNASPKKAVEKMVELRAEEWAPPGSDGFAPAYDHAQLPAPANDDVARKVQRVAHFLLTNPALHPEAVAEYLTTPAVFPLQVCVAYLAACDLAGLSVVDALQRFLMAVPLPKEGQRIERLLEYFCSAYYTANHVGGVSQHVFPFANEDACFVVVVALVMLNTDLHNPRAGSRMNEESFRAQMRGCNADQDFPPGFVDELFHHIRCHPLSDRSRGGGGGGDGTTTPSSSSGAVAPPPTSDTRSSFDALFISEEERRHIAFGLEQQRRITSVADALATQPILRDPLDCQPLADWSFCRAAACDLFLATWSSVCAVFGPAVYEDGTNNNNSVGQDEVLLRCIRGLQALLCVAASFALSVEAEVTMLALLRMAEYASVRRVCHNAVLAVCSTIHSMHLSARCWLDVFGIMVELRTKQAQSSGEHVERVLARIEAFNRLASDEVVGEVAPSLLAPASATLMMPTNATTTTTSSSSAVASLATIALERLYEGAMDWLCSAAHKDGLSVSAGTSYLRRALEYTLITHPTKHNRSRAARHTAEMKVDVVTMINVRGFSRVIMPRLVELVGAHQHSDEALDLIIRFVVDLLHVMWSSYASRKVALRRPPPQFDAAQQQQEDDDDDGVAVAAVNPSTFMIDSAPPEFVDCYDFFGICFSQHSNSALVRAHLLQGVKELMSRTLLLAEQSSSSSSSSITQPQQLEQHACLGSQSLALYTMISAWRRLLVPIASALAESEASETMSLAVLVLRHLVVGSHPSNHSATRSATHLPREVRGAVLMLLANLAYLGGMCADGDAAQACLGQLSSICSISLTMENVVGASTSANTSCQVVRDDSMYSGPASPTSMTEAVSTSTEAMGYPRSQPDKLVHRLMDQLHVNEHVASQHAVERLVRLLRADQSEIRVEALEHCRSLSLQMQPAQVRHIALQVMHVVLEAAVELPQPTNEVPLSDPSLLAFGVFWVDIPSTLRRCSRAAFRQSLNAVLSFATRDLITAAPANMACTLATLMVERCLTPMLVSPNILSASSAPIAAAAVLQCASLAMPRCTSAERGQLMDVVRHAVGLTLWLRKMPMERAAVPAEANFPGRAYLFSDTNNNNNSNTSTSWQGQAYDHAATEAIHRLGTLTPAEIAGAGVSLRIHGGDSSERSSAAPTPVPTSTTTASATIPSRVRGARSGAAGGDALLVADEQLSEYINLLVSLLTALPKLIQQAVSDDDDGVEMHHTHTAHDHDHDDGMWKAPAIAASDLLRLLLDAAAALFAVLWRVRHPQQMEAFVAQRFTRDGASAGRNTNNNNNNTSSSSLVPHAAIRGVLNSYLELALMADSYPVEHIVPIMLCILDVLREMQASLPSNTSNSSSPLSSSTPKTHKSVYEASTALERAALQRLSPQEQQHIRGCAVGMYQELSVVLGQWVSKIVVMERKGGERVCALRPLLLQPPVFRSVVELLTPLSGPIISVARDYLNAYIGEEESNKNSVIDA